MAPQPDLGDSLKPYSCLTCRQRKVKCDRRSPCSNCTKANSQCSFVAPVRGKRKRTKLRREGLHAKLKRYEDLLRSYGAKIEPSDHDDELDDDLDSTGDIQMSEDTKYETQKSGASVAPEEIRPRFVIKDGSSRYFDTALWSSMGDESRHPEEGATTESAEESIISQDDLAVGLLDPNTPVSYLHGQTESFATLQPPLQLLSQCLDIFVERVDPLTKILHLPTFRASLTDATQSPQKVSRSLKAVILAFYLVVIAAMGEDECQNLFSGSKSDVFTKYRLAARQALIRAGLLDTSNPETLHAYAIFLVAVRKCHRSDTLFVMSGIAVRLARRMGLHRDGVSLGLSPFETEMRRRLWWHIVQVDIRVSDIVGAKPSADLFSGDAKMPLNVADEDLVPNMMDPPPERSGITPIVLCLIRCELVHFMRSFSPNAIDDVRLEALASSDIPLEKKDDLINNFEDLLERKYLRYCDPSNSLHALASIFCRSLISRMRLLAHNPRRLGNSGNAIPQSERDLIFANATKLLEYVNIVQESPVFEKLRWQMGTTYLWNTILCVLIEARHRQTGPEVDKLWKLIGSVFANYNEMFEETAGAVYTAMGRWTLRVWDDYVSATKAEGRPEPTTPEFIDAIRRCREPVQDGLDKSRDVADSGHLSADFAGLSEMQFPGQDGMHLPQTDYFSSQDFSNFFNFEIDTNEWGRWV